MLAGQPLIHATGYGRPLNVPLTFLSANGRSDSH